MNISRFIASYGLPISKMFVVVNNVHLKFRSTNLGYSYVLQCDEKTLLRDKNAANIGGMGKSITRTGEGGIPYGDHVNCFV